MDDAPAMYGELKFRNGSSIHNNFNTYQLIRHSQAPEEIEVFFVENEIAPTGLGEPGLSPAVGALANALYPGYRPAILSLAV